VAIQCPQCESEQVQRVSVAYQSGVSTVQSHTVGVGLVAGGALGVGGAKTRGTQQSALSQSLAPPSKRRMRGGIILAVVGLFSLLAAPGGEKITGLILLLGGCAWAYPSYRYNHQQYPALMNQWHAEFFCNVCGHIFNP